MKLKKLKKAGTGVLVLSLISAEAFSQGFLVVDQASGTTNGSVAEFVGKKLKMAA